MVFFSHPKNVHTQHEYEKEDGQVKKRIKNLEQKTAWEEMG